MGKEPPGFVPARPASLHGIRPGLEQDDRVDLAKRERSPSCPSLPASSSLQASLSPAASQPLPGASLFSRSQLSLLWGAPSYRGRSRRCGRGRGRRRRAPGRRGSGWPQSPRQAGHTGRLGPRGGATRPRAAPPGFPRVSALTPGRPWSHKSAPEEKGTKRTRGALPPLPERRTCRCGDHHRRPSRPLPGDRGRLHRATDTD